MSPIWIANLIMQESIEQFPFESSSAVLNSMQWLLYKFNIQLHLIPLPITSPSLYSPSRSLSPPFLFSLSPLPLPSLFTLPLSLFSFSPPPLPSPSHPSCADWSAPRSRPANSSAVLFLLPLTWSILTSLAATSSLMWDWGGWYPWGGD